MDLRTGCDLLTCSLEELVARARHQLKDLAYSPSQVTAYSDAWRDLLKFARQEKAGGSFSDALVQRFLADCGIDIANLAKPLTHRESTIRSAIRTLAHFALTGCCRRCSTAQRRIALPPGMQSVLQEYEKFCTEHLRLQSRTISKRTVGITSFLSFMHSQRLSSLSEIGAAELSRFVSTQGHVKTVTLASLVSDLRCFLRYLCMQGILAEDLSPWVPKVRRRRDEQIPSVWKREHVTALLASVDRDSSKGKRDYAMLLLACRLGLRAGDIRDLCIEHIRWDEPCIEVPQSKTKVRLKLPLSEEIGEALIDYLRHARPRTKHREVFLKTVRPFEPFSSNNSLYQIVALYRLRAGVTLPARLKRGMHALRHTLATRLLEQETPIETIAAVLGHQCLDSTRIYAKVDVAALRDAALEPEEVNHA